MGVFKIPDIPRYGIVLEEDLSNSIFKEVYEGAARSVVEIIKHNQENETGELFLNSSVIFTGERGSGKSSAMNTFASFLGTPDKYSSWLDSKQFDIIKNNNFYVLPSIDATQMGLKETLLGSISAKMFNDFQKKQKNILQMSSKATLEQQREFVRKAQHVNRVSYMYQTGEWYKDNDELLQNTTSIEGLKEEFHELVECFLSIMTDAYDRKKTYLVIVVDDIDMSIENSFSIVDEIRKFLTEKNIIVLTSVHMQQLKKVIAEHFYQSLTSTGKIKEKPFIYHTANSLSEKYIEKIFPIARQQEMPRLNFEQLSSYTVENLIENVDDAKKYWKDLNIELNVDSNNPTIMHGLLHLIYKKTLLLLLPNEYNRHWLIPQNIRSLVNFVMFLKNMEDVAYIKDGNSNFRAATNDELKEKTEVIEKNLDALMQYIVHDMSSFVASDVNNEDDDLAAVLTQLIHDLPDWSIETINGKIVRDILYHINGYKLSSNNEKFYSEIFSETSRELINASMHSKLVSLGDVLYVLGKIDSKTASWEIKRLVEIVRVIWSIRATKEFFVSGIKQTELVSSDCGKYVTHAFRYMIGGFMVNPDCSKFLPYNYGKSQCNTDWMFVNFDVQKYSKTYSEKEKDYILEILKFIYVFQPPVDCIRELQENEKILPLTDWRKYDNHEEAYFERTTQSSSNAPICLALNYMSIFTNMLSTNKLGNRFASRTLIPSEENDRNSSMRTLAVEWQNKYIMFFPFYSMDYMCRLYNKVHYNSLAKTKQYLDFEHALAGFFGEFCDQTEIIENCILNKYVCVNNSDNSERELAICNYSKGVISFKKQITQKDEGDSFVKMIADLLDILDCDIYMLKDSISSFLTEIKKQTQDTINLVFASQIRELKTSINKFSPLVIKEILLNELKDINEMNYSDVIEKISSVIKQFEEDNAVEAYVY